jgi:uncharacterized phage protein (TIGR02218 family)
MRAIPPALADHLATGATTLCHCWRLEPRGGDAMGFTDHDRDLTFDGTLFEADAGFTATEIESSLGLAVDNLEASGALSSSKLNEQRLAAGDFDNAAIEVWRVNWQDTSQRVLIRRGNLGEVTRGPNAFSAELRGIAHALNQPQGRIFQYGCDAVLGGARCGVELDDPAFSVETNVLSSEDNRRLSVEGTEDFVENWFARGTGVFVTGANAGRAAEIKFHRRRGDLAIIEFWQPLPYAIENGDRVVLKAGCDKQFSTCRGKFANAVNFRGFPHIPGDDFVLTYANSGDPENDGGSRNS